MNNDRGTRRESSFLRNLEAKRLLELRLLNSGHTLTEAMEAAENLQLER